MRRPLVYIFIALAMTEPVFAADPSGCDSFAWSVTQDQRLFTASDKPIIASGTTLVVPPSGALVLKLAPNGAIAWTLPPERSRNSSGSLGGIVVLPAPAHPGIYQITLSADAWVDDVQDGQYARAVGSSGRSDCEGLRKSLRLELRQLPISLQISGSSSEAMTIAIRLVE